MSHSQAQETTTKSYQAQILLPNEPHIATAIYNFTSPDEAHAWLRAAIPYLEGFVQVVAWRVHPSDEPPTHVLKAGRPIKLGSFLCQ
jgi:hypothetical protein